VGLGLDGDGAYMKDCNQRRYLQRKHLDGMAKRRTTSGRQRAGRRLLWLKTFDALDQRTLAARKAVCLKDSLVGDLGGPDNVSALARPSYASTRASLAL
jgi:hypothetical protein